MEIPKDTMRTLSLIGKIADVTDILEDVIYLTEARYLAGEALHVDGDAGVERW